MLGRRRGVSLNAISTSRSLLPRTSLPVPETEYGSDSAAVRQQAGRIRCRRRKATDDIGSEFQTRHRTYVCDAKGARSQQLAEQRGEASRSRQECNGNEWPVLSRRRRSRGKGPRCLSVGANALDEGDSGTIWRYETCRRFVWVGKGATEGNCRWLGGEGESGARDNQCLACCDGRETRWRGRGKSS